MQIIFQNTIHDIGSGWNQSYDSSSAISLNCWLSIFYFFQIRIILKAYFSMASIRELISKEVYLFLA